MVKRCLAIFLFFFILGLSFAKDDLPEPVGWVNDFAKAISPEYIDKINSLIAEAEEKTSAEIAVVTIDSIAPYDEKEYARLLFDKWKPGKKGKDNGILILLALKERRWRIETGYGVEGFLPDALCGQIGRNIMVPYFKKGQYGEGLYQGVDAVAKVLSGETPAINEGTTVVSSDSVLLLILAIIGILAGQVLLLIVIGLLFLVVLPLPLNVIIFIIFLVLSIIRIFTFPIFMGTSSRRGYGGYYGSWGGGFGGGGFGGFGGGGGGGGGAGGGW